MEIIIRVGQICDKDLIIFFDDILYSGLTILSWLP